ncbi:MAG: Bax inhibitor-1/YccA family protein [Desulfomonilaceae bacterium]|nr:Bax inhibitor-1/YccA family protein [Desulfomonilaceae bacterium]
MELRSGNPALGDRTFQGLGIPATDEETMTIQGTVNKTAFLLALVLLTSGWTWYLYSQTMDPASVMPWVIVGAVGGLIVALVTVFKPAWSPITASLYALLEGLFIGGISAILESQYPGIVFQAVGLTFGTLAVLLMVYKSGLIKVTDNFRMGIVAATGGIFLVYLVSIVLGLFGVNVPYIHGSGLVGIGFSVFVVVIAALNLVLDFDFIEKGSQSGAPAYMEWFGAFGLMVTLVWLYIEILRLLAKLRSRN